MIDITKLNPCKIFEAWHLQN